MKTKICAYCGHVGKPIPQAKSSFVVDAFIWMITLSLTAFSGLVPLLLIPLAWTLYHIAKFNSVKCPKCECLEMVPLNSRKGKAIRSGKTSLQAWSDEESQGTASGYQ